MDAFQARLQFLQVVKNLHKNLHAVKDTSQGSNASQQQNDPVQFYVRNYEHHYEDFQQCLLDSALKMDSLDRLNVLIYWQKLVEALWPRCRSEIDGERNTPAKVLYTQFLGRLDEIVQLVLPAHDWKSLTNLDACVAISKRLNSLCSVVPENDPQLQKLDLTRDEILQQIDPKGPELPWFSPPLATDYETAFSTTCMLLVDRRKHAIQLQEYYRRHLVCGISTAPATSTGGASTTASAATANSSGVILHRMENDRERHKKSKEHLWVTERQYILDSREFDTLWNSTKGMAKSDYVDLRIMNNIAHSSYMYN
ncbi:LAMI_0G01596g1_1 [Lachancea mirantina]|uniref:LAMI_0G01596g1_1 n=1 Tax=Lachancea mirantina TaxID=1230905 RepID=A0A1G4K7L3_9SACH|nr:LAMI_0G01596g1_1 [Lachancea mirantina]